MHLNRLHNLEEIMRNNDVERYRFEYIHNGHKFDTIFLIDQNPFKLWLGAVKGDFVLGLDVNPDDFSIDAYIDGNNYSKLCSFLGLKYQKGRPFSSSAFLTDFDNNISRVVENFNSGNISRPQDMIRYYRDVEEVDKKYFYGWKDNNIRNENVRPENLTKTFNLLGTKVHEFCRDYNYSTRWSDIARDEITLVFPKKKLISHLKTTEAVCSSPTFQSSA
jgi:hypothetical protein